jgi:superfamily II DNA or RNA helicase
MVKRTWLWRDWPDRWGADIGVDLVVETHEDDLWAVQAKAYDARYSVTKRDVDSFLSESNRPMFAFRLLLATTDRVARNARSALEGQEKPVGLRLRSDLAAVEIAWPKTVERLLPTKSKPKRLRGYQRRALSDVLTGFDSADRGQLLMACGTGKTLIGLHVAEELESHRTLVLLPSLSLVEQTLREWTANGRRPFSYAAVCSDASVVEQDSVVASTVELGVPVTTDASEVAEFLRGRRDHSVVFATYQSSDVIKQAQSRRGVPWFDLLIADEAHRCVGPEAGVFATALDEAKIKAKRRLFMTATPRYFTGRLKRQAREVDYQVASMDDRTRFGPVFHHLTFGEAIEQDLLSDYQLAVVGVTNATYRDYAQRGVFVAPDGTSITDARTLGSQLGLLRAMSQYDLHRVVSFHSRVSSARSFATTLPLVCAWMPSDRRPDGTLWTDYVDGNMPSGQRRTRLTRLRETAPFDRSVLTNARCLTEGIDVPTLDGVAFIDPRNSQVDIVQAVGRAIRKSDDKTVGTIIVPVFVDEDVDSERALESSEFKRVWDIVKALRAHDETLANELDELRRELGRRRTTVARPQKIQLDLPVGVAATFATAFDARLVTQTTAPWEFWFGLLQRYSERFGQARPPKDYVEGGYRLGGWVADQRRANDRGRLSDERQRRLEALQGWVWNTYEADWEDGYAATLNFVDREGHARVPKGHREAGYRLGQWIEVQRRFFAENRLSTSRIDRLLALPGWTWNTFDTEWERGFAFLAAFASREGNAKVPYGHVEEGFPLGPWAARLRAAHTKGLVPPERRARLAELPGWEWHRHDAAWERGYAHLQTFVARMGHARVPAKHVESGFRLGVWVSSQRTQRRLRRLSEERADRLMAVPGWEWSPFGPAWEEGFSRLQRFTERVGDARVPTSYEGGDGYRLGTWVKEQRRMYRQGRLSAEREARLEALPGWTWGGTAA